jgi:hypothetical protein
VATLKILAYSSTQYFGFFARARHGEICRLITAIGILFNADFADGATKAFGQKCLKTLLMSRIMNG